MQRCFQLARLGAGAVAPNPMVGAVLVYEDRIIGEGYHKMYGQPHAEVNCISNVAEADRAFIAFATLYVSLEPCAHFGKTPPCTQLIIDHKIPKLVIAVTDPFEKVNGEGINRLRAAGVEVTTGLLEQEGAELNKRFFTFHQQRRPYIILKWAQTANGFIGTNDRERLHISNGLTNRLVHKWRSEEAAILVGSETARRDDPALTARLYPGANPVRIVLNRKNDLPASLQLFDKKVKTIVFNRQVNTEEDNLLRYKINDTENILQQVLNALYELQLQSVIVEGGAALLHKFIEQQCWDEARIITNTSLVINEGVAAPTLTNAALQSSIDLHNDHIAFYAHTK